MTQVSRLHAVDMTEISGSARPAFAALIAEIQERLSTGEELGLSLFVDVEGDPVVDERIAGPLGADFHIGVPATEVHRVADIEPPLRRPLAILRKRCEKPEAPDEYAQEGDCCARHCHRRIRLN